MSADGFFKVVKVSQLLVQYMYDVFEDDIDPVGLNQVRNVGDKTKESNGIALEKSYIIDSGIYCTYYNQRDTSK